MVRDCWTGKQLWLGLGEKGHPITLSSPKTLESCLGPDPGFMELSESVCQGIVTCQHGKSRKVRDEGLQLLSARWSLWHWQEKTVTVINPRVLVREKIRPLILNNDYVTSTATVTRWENGRNMFSREGQTFLAMSSVTLLSKVKINKCTEIKADNEQRQSEPQQTARVLSLINHILSLSDKRLSGP